MKKSLLVVVYLIAVFFAVDSCYIVIIPKDKYWAALEALLAGFFILSIVILSDKEKSKNN